MVDHSDPGSDLERARALIEDVARRNGTFTHAFRERVETEANRGRGEMLRAIENGDDIRGNFVEALKISSGDRITTCARFLMEIVQNADDNTYSEDKTPTLWITIRPDLVKIESNEKDFSKEHVEAICAIDQNSKRSGHDCIGEKGPGFKSVFKLANRAHIRSANYYFELDQRRELGTITPQWDEEYFDDHKRARETTIILDHISIESDNFATALEEDVRAFDPIVLLFLRQIKRLRISLSQPHLGGTFTISKRFRCVDRVADSGIVSLKDECSQISSYFYKHRFIASFTGYEPKRPNAATTEIVLAFPVKKEKQSYVPWIRKGNFAFAYLPVADFGFHFVIHADFITTPNRRSIEEENRWNMNIANAIPHAFEAAVANFNQGDTRFAQLARHWPLYLDNDCTGSTPYWVNIKNHLGEHLKSAPVLRDWNGGLKKPTSLMYPYKPYSRSHEPLLGNMSDFVSPDYPDSVLERLEHLGVQDCDVPKVVTQILQYQKKMTSLDQVLLAAQLQFLYEVRHQLEPDVMGRIRFTCSNCGKLQVGSSMYADVWMTGELRPLFKGNRKVHFLDDLYIKQIDLADRDSFGEWLARTASVATIPRLTSTQSDVLHQDFEWLLENKSGQALSLLQKYWKVYKKSLTTTMRFILSGQNFLCSSGSRVPLKQTYLPLAEIIEKAAEFTGALDCHFLLLPGNDSKQWTFLSDFGVGISEGLNFYLWVLKQPSFNKQMDFGKAKKLYLEIQLQARTPIEREITRNAFHDASILLPDKRFIYHKKCVWRGFRGPTSKLCLYNIFGDELHGLFCDVLKVQNATNVQARESLQKLRVSETTNLADVVEVYVFIQDHCADTFNVDRNAPCIALPQEVGSQKLVWKTTAQCVWDGEVPSKDELNSHDKVSIRQIVETHAPNASRFFTDVLKIGNPDLEELVGDLTLLKNSALDVSKQVDWIYKSISSCKGVSAEQIRSAFETQNLVFIRGKDVFENRWVQLTACVWDECCLRKKHALINSLKHHQKLFCGLLQVREADSNMHVDELTETINHIDPMVDNDGYSYVRDLLMGIAALPKKAMVLERLKTAKCWPCRTAENRRELRSIEQGFFINDNQQLFDIFSTTHACLDFDMRSSNKIKSLLTELGCGEYLSEWVKIELKPSKPLQFNGLLTADLRRRAGALMRYLTHAGCKPSQEHRKLLQSVKVWDCAYIWTEYKMDRSTATRSDGGSGVQVSSHQGGAPVLEVFFSNDEDEREYAIAYDLPGQLLAALELDETLLDLASLSDLLRLPIGSLTKVLIKKGISGDVIGEDGKERLDIESSARVDIRDSSPDNDGAATGGATDGCHDGGVQDIVQDTPGTFPIAVHSSSTHMDADARSIPDTTRWLRRPRKSLPNQALDVPSIMTPCERPVSCPPQEAGMSSEQRLRNNMKLVADYARTPTPASICLRKLRNQDEGNDRGVFNLTEIETALPVSTPENFRSATPGSLPSSSSGKQDPGWTNAVGAVGEGFVYHVLRDWLKLTNFKAETNWNSTLRIYDGYLSYQRALDASKGDADIVYRDIEGKLTEYFRQIVCPYKKPNWLATILDNSNKPEYLMEVKSTQGIDPKTAFYMSKSQLDRAWRLRVLPDVKTPQKVYVLMRVSGVDIVDCKTDALKLTVFLDPFSLIRKANGLEVDHYAIKATG